MPPHVFIGHRRIYSKELKYLFMSSSVAQFGRYLVVGVLNATIDFAILNFLSISFGVYSGPGIIPMKTVAFSIVVVHSYFWNKYWTFGTRDGSLHFEFLKFLIACLFGLFINVSIVFAITTYLIRPVEFSPLVWENLANTLAIGVGIIWNFTAFKFFVFRGRATFVSSVSQ